MPRNFIEAVTSLDLCPHIACIVNYLKRKVKYNLQKDVEKLLIGYFCAFLAALGRFSPQGTCARGQYRVQYVGISIFARKIPSHPVDKRYFFHSYPAKSCKYFLWSSTGYTSIHEHT